MIRRRLRKIGHAFIALYDACGKTYISTITDKPTKRQGFVEAFGDRVRISMPLNAYGSVNYALEDIERMTIQCTWCGEAIFIGDPITLIVPADRNFVAPPYAVTYREDDETHYVGCIRPGCCEGLFESKGIWDAHPEDPTQGYVHRQLSAEEALMANPAAEGARVSRGRDGIKVDLLN